MPFVYILECSDKSYYTGYAIDLEKRLQQHQEGTGSKYTRGRCPVRLVYQEEWPTKGEAMSREFEIKHWSRKQKEYLIANSIT